MNSIICQDYVTLWSSILDSLSLPPLAQSYLTWKLNKMNHRQQKDSNKKIRNTSKNFTIMPHRCWLDFYDQILHWESWGFQQWEKLFDTLLSNINWGLFPLFVGKIPHLTLG